MVDTRAGFWLLLVIQLVAAAIVAALLVAGSQDEQDFADFFTVSLWVTSLLLPVLGILAVTSEWSQRTGLTTFALVSLAMTGTDWAQIATAAALWVGLFLVAGAWRLRRTELK